MEEASADIPAPATNSISVENPNELSEVLIYVYSLRLELLARYSNRMLMKLNQPYQEWCTYHLPVGRTR